MNAFSVLALKSRQQKIEQWAPKSDMCRVFVLFSMLISWSSYSKKLFKVDAIALLRAIILLDLRLQLGIETFLDSQRASAHNKLSELNVIELQLDKMQLWTFLSNSEAAWYRAQSLNPFKFRLKLHSACINCVWKEQAIVCNRRDCALFSFFYHVYDG